MSPRLCSCISIGITISIRCVTATSTISLRCNESIFPSLLQLLRLSEHSGHGSPHLGDGGLRLRGLGFNTLHGWRQEQIDRDRGWAEGPVRRLAHGPICASSASSSCLPVSLRLTTL